MLIYCICYAGTVYNLLVYCGIYHVSFYFYLCINIYVYDYLYVGIGVDVGG